MMAYGNLKVYDFVRESRDGVVEAESVLSKLRGGEDKVSLPLFLAIHDDPLFARLSAWAVYCIGNCGTC